MKAAVVSSFGTAPRYQDFPAPQPAGDHDMVIDVIAAGLHPRVRSQADGSHYTSTGELPLIPGIDGIGRGADGSLRYFILPDTTMGSMAEQTVIDVRRSITVPAGGDPIAVAAGMNPAMSSWIALRQRVRFAAGQDVLILGATGNAGQPLAWIQVGSMAGPEAPVPSATLRAARLQVIGSGQGSVPTRDILTELPALAREITAGTFDLSARPVPLADVEHAWADTARTPPRVVLTP